MQSIADNILLLLLRGAEWGGAFTVQLFSEPGCLLLYLAIYLAVYGLCYRMFIRNYEYGDEDLLTRKVMMIVIGISFVNVILGGAEPPQNSVQAEQLFFFMLIARLLLGMLGLVMLFFCSNGPSCNLILKSRNTSCSSSASSMNWRKRASIR